MFCFDSIHEKLINELITTGVINFFHFYFVYKHRCLAHIMRNTHNNINDKFDKLTFIPFPNNCSDSIVWFDCLIFHWFRIGFFISQNRYICSFAYNHIVNRIWIRATIMFNEYALIKHFQWRSGQIPTVISLQYSNRCYFIDDLKLGPGFAGRDKINRGTMIITRGLFLIKSNTLHIIMLNDLRILVCWKLYFRIGKIPIPFNKLYSYWSVDIAM